MEHLDVQGKGNKVAATQGKITAQNPTNQSLKFDSKILGVFTEEQLLEISKHLGDDNPIKPRFVVDTFKMIDRIVKGARMPEDKKGLIKMGYGLLAGLIPTYREPFDYFTAQEFYPGDLDEELLEEEGAEYVVEAAEYEMGCLLTDVVNEMLVNNKDGFYDDTIYEWLCHIDEYAEAVAELGLEFTNNGKDILEEVAKIREASEDKTHYNDVN